MASRLFKTNKILSAYESFEKVNTSKVKDSGLLERMKRE